MKRPPLKIVFFGDSSSRFSNRIFQPLYSLAGKWPEEYVLKGVVDAPKGGWVSTNLATVAPEDSFLTAAAALGVPVATPASEDLAPLKADLYIAVGYTRLVRETLLSLPTLYMVNFHASLLPAYRGKHPVFRALQAGEKMTGLSVHVMDASLDTGPLLYQSRVRVKRRDSVAALYERIMDAGSSLMKRLLNDARQGALTPYPQNTEGASYFSSVDEADFQISFDRQAPLLEQRICATPGKCYFVREKKKVFLLEVRASMRKCPPPWGRITASSGKTFRLAVPGGSLIVSAVREDGEKPETGTGFVKRKCLRSGMFIQGERDG